MVRAWKPIDHTKEIEERAKDMKQIDAWICCFILSLQPQRKLGTVRCRITAMQHFSGSKDTRHLVRTEVKEWITRHYVVSSNNVAAVCMKENSVFRAPKARVQKCPIFPRFAAPSACEPPQFTQSLNHSVVIFMPPHDHRCELKDASACPVCNEQRFKADGSSRKLYYSSHRAYVQYLYSIPTLAA